MFFFQKLIELCGKHGLDQGMVTYLCADRKQRQRVMRALPESPFYITSDRQVAANIKEISHHLMASTGGPNTMVSENFSEPFSEVTIFLLTVQVV